MTTGTLTIISGIVLLLVFAFVGWSVRRRARIRDEKSNRTDERELP